jgi:type 1 glutamine amidotransferase
LLSLQETEFTFDWMTDTGSWSPEGMAAYRLVILAKSNQRSPEDQTAWMEDSVQEAFKDYVRRGNGLLAVHAGTVDYEKAPVLRKLLGGAFARHPDQCPVTMIPIEGHPLVCGCTTFMLKDEHYFMAMEDPQVDVFLTTLSEHGEQPGAWTRTEGEGRVAVLTPGHNPEVWLHPSFQALLLNAMRWCCRAD